ncbi:MAG: PGRS family protein [Frankia sp.]|nr:PGRS family protein [Frankia sp.]
MSGQRFLPRRRAVGRGGRDRGDTSTVVIAYLAIAIVSALIGYTLNKMVTDSDNTAAPAPAPSASAGAPNSAEPLGLTAEQVAIQLASLGLPLQTTIVFDAATDPNHLLGQPNGYSSKIAFVDARTGINPATVTAPDPVEQGGSIEVFQDPAGASRRAQELRATSGQSQLLQEFTFQRADVVLRLSRYFTEADARAYEQALNALAPGGGVAPGAGTAAGPGTGTGGAPGGSATAPAG